MQRTINETVCGRMRCTLTEVRINGKTTYHVAKRKGLLYVSCSTYSDSDIAISSYNSLCKELTESVK